MKKLHLELFGLLCLLIFTCANSVNGQIKISATISSEKIGGKIEFYANVKTDTPFKKDTIPIAAIYDEDGNQVGREVKLIPDNLLVFRIKFNTAPSPNNSYEVVIHEFQIDETNIVGGKIGISSLSALLKIIVNGQQPACVSEDRRSSRYISLSIRVPETLGSEPMPRLAEIYSWFQDNATIGKMNIEFEPLNGNNIISTNDVERLGLPLTIAELQDQRGFVVCFATAQPPPTSEYNIKIGFPDDAPFELRGGVKKSELPGFANIDLPSDTDIQPDKAKLFSLGQNLDVSVVLASSVSDNKQPNGTVVRQRTTRGSLDLFIAPIINLRTGAIPPAQKKFIGYWTPIYLDAKVSTGKITEDTLSLNRIEFGTEKEWRYISNTKNPDFYRLILKGSHVSDRDFRQGEYKATFEVQPYWGKLVNPIEKYAKVFKSTIDADVTKTVVNKRFGYSLIPVIGGEIGRTYFRRNPAEAIMPSDTIKRFYVGLDTNFQFTEKLNISLTDKFYVRGESSIDRQHNYFKGSIEYFPEGNKRKNFSYGFFLSFERGGLPPFSNPDVNATKFGFRIISRNWLDRFR